MNRRLASRTKYIEVEELGKEIKIEPFPIWDRRKEPFPCVDESSPETQGIFYVKVPKTSSSTLAGVTTRIAAKEAKRHGGFDIANGKYCKTHDPMVHASAYALKCGSRDRKKSFLWTIMREPNARAVSHYGMRLAFGDVKLNDKEFRANLKGNNSFRTNTQLSFMTTKRITGTPEDSELPMYVQDVLDEYDFVGIYERLHESLVVMSMLMGANINDVIFNYRPLHNARCGALEEPSWLTDGNRHYLQSIEWTRRQKGDFLLYDAVNKKLDATIDMLGRDIVKTNLDTFEKLLYVGTDLSSRIRRKPGCGVLFSKPYGDIDELKTFIELSDAEKRFVLEHVERD